MPRPSSCKECRFWEPNVARDGHGFCLRYPPSVDELETYASGWCGEHQPAAPAPPAGARLVKEPAPARPELDALIEEGIKARAATITLPPNPPLGSLYRVEHDGFEGEVIGHYRTREGKWGAVLQQRGTKVVHVYGLKWLTAIDPGEER